MSYSQLYIEYKMPEGVTLEAVKQDIGSIEDYLMQREDVTHVTSSFGGTPSRYNLVRSIALPATSYGELIVDFTDADALKAAIPGLQQYLTDNYPQAYVRIKRYNLMYEEFPVEVMFSGPDPAVLKDLAARAQQIMEDEPSATLVTNNWEPETPVLMVDYYQPIARRAGLSRSDVGLSLLAATEGMPVGSYYEGTTALPIYVKSVDNKGGELEGLENVPVWSILPSLSGLNGETVKELLLGTLKEEDLQGSDEEIAERLLINAGDVSALKSYYRDAVTVSEIDDEEKVVVLFRFATSDYYSAAVDIMELRTILPDKHTEGQAYRAWESVFFDFDIIQLTFNKDGVYKVIPVVSSPIDIVNAVTPPVQMPDDTPWWKILLGILLGILLIVLLVPLLPWIARAIVWIVCLPFRFAAYCKAQRNYKRQKKKEKQKE